MTKYSNLNVFKYFNDVFDYLPIGSLINNQIFCVHGGLSYEIETLDEIEGYDRIKLLAKYEPIWDLVYNYPADDINEWYHPKNSCYYFREKITKKFNANNKLKFIVSGSGFEMFGFKWYHDNQICIIFSAPNFNEKRNLAAMVNINEYCEHNIIQFHPALIQNKNNEESNKNIRILDYFC